MRAYLSNHSATVYGLLQQHQGFSLWGAYLSSHSATVYGLLQQHQGLFSVRGLPLPTTVPLFMAYCSSIWAFLCEGPTSLTTVPLFMAYCSSIWAFLCEGPTSLTTVPLFIAYCSSIRAFSVRGLPLWPQCHCYSLLQQPGKSPSPSGPDAACPLCTRRRKSSNVNINN